MDPVFAALIAHARAVPWRDPGSPFASLTRAVVGQQISVKAAASVWGRLLTRLGLPDNGVPQPTALAQLSPTDLRECGLSQRKAEYAHALAAHFLQVDFDEQAFLAQDDAQLIRELTAIRGIGRWTAEMFLMFHLHRPDVLPVADLGLRAGIGSLYGDGTPLLAPAVQRHALAWRPYCSAATWLVWRYHECDGETRERLRSHRV